MRAVPGARCPAPAARQQPPRGRAGGVFRDGIIAAVSASVTAALSALGARDPVLDGLIGAYPRPPARRPVPGPLRFAALARAIVYQQLAGRAAAVIHGRVVVALGGEVTPSAVLAASPELLASCGLSGAKTASLRDLAAKVDSGEVALGRIGRLSDEEIVEHLTRVRGIGTWTAQMFLLGTLGRQDVWPVGDYGVRAGFAKAWGLPDVLRPVDLEALGEPFRPYRSLVAWYCWRVVDTRLP
jgi:DNA-3-methyladenine glycosylase II